MLARVPKDVECVGVAGITLLLLLVLCAHGKLACSSTHRYAAANIYVDIHGIVQSPVLTTKFGPCSASSRPPSKPG